MDHAYDLCPLCSSLQKEPDEGSVFVGHQLFVFQLKISD